jgi:hypothetical protein
MTGFFLIHEEISPNSARSGSKKNICDLSSLGDAQGVNWGSKQGTSMILCFYRLKVEIFKEKHKIIDVPIYPPYIVLFFGYKIA